MEFNKLSIGGGDMKSNFVRSSTPTAHKLKLRQQIQKIVMYA